MKGFPEALRKAQGSARHPIFEPSTRTQMSFQTAALRLGGSVISFDNPQSSSVPRAIL